MNTKNIALFFIISAVSIFLTSCDKESEINPNEKGSIGLHFDNRAGSSDLALNTGNYTNALNQALNITTFNYFVSNIKLHNEDGSVYTVPQAESYFLIKESEAESQEIELNDVPEGNYNKITFTIGVDSLRNTMPISERTGALDPAGEAEGMYWMWNSGYIFMKMEGTSPVAPLDSASNTNLFMYHIGGFGGYSSQTINNIKEVTLSFGNESAKVRNDNMEAPEAHLYVDALKVLNGSTNIDISATPVVMFAQYSTNIANNYANMFSVNHVHNHN
ncbi:hypothetical protein C7N43_35200 [Sphingobacteriales bacterium UPWRP_1]|nr:hypothetical protein B6N25_02545 [Sphingobacteriales bacterium TSM_CSS]PSJ72249.1 hypothetical protein C7N43_35200 [Sphingobacteriales bacterium UPWRP_1]